MSIPAVRSFPAVYGVKPSARLVRRHSRLRGGLRASSVAVNGEVGLGSRITEKEEDAVKEVADEEDRGLEPLYDDGFGAVTVKDYFAAAKALSKYDDGGPPRWFCPVESGQPAVEDAPLLLFLPGSSSNLIASVLVLFSSLLITTALHDESKVALQFSVRSLPCFLLV
jgi:hypothetical protein